MFKFIFLGFFLVIPFFSFCQHQNENFSEGNYLLFDSLNSAGGDSSNESGSLSFSVGQAFYNHNISDDAVVLEGVQQSEILDLFNPRPTPVKKINIVAYPNPMTSYVTLNIDVQQPKNYSYQLFTIGGKLLETDKITDTKTIIYTSSLPNAVYLLKVLKNNITQQTLKIIKK